MINLNDNSLLENQGVSIFNAGNAGRVENVKVTIEPKAKDDESKSPDAKIFFEDSMGKCNMGYYFSSKNEMYDEEKNAKNAQNKIIQLLSLAKAMVADDFVFPDVAGMSNNDIEKVLLGVIKKHEGATVNVFVAYGGGNYPSKYLVPRMFNYVEKASVSATDSKLKASNYDIMVRPEENTTPASNQTGAPASTGGSFWG